jgi:uncharacterized protein GlcG (DUF336 family)
MKSRKPNALLAIALAGISTLALADDGNAQGGKPCGIPDATVARVQSKLSSVVMEENGGLFSPSRSWWSAVVDREGVLCSVIRTGDAWPGSRAISIAKANTANAFSNNQLALSTANLYAPTQPGGPLYGLNNSNPFNPDYLAQGSGIGRVPGGIITFGGGVPLYVDGKVIGGLGLSGNSACADHVVAYRMRRAAGLDKIPSGVAPGGTDNIIFATGTPTGFQHPHCGTSDIAPDAI